jgi:thymidylate synthase (FAD)
MATIHLHNKTKNVLNKGFIRLVDCMPRVVPYDSWGLKCDSAIVQAARVSFGSGMKDLETDKRLINFLLQHKHTSPFEMVKFKFHVKAPIFVQRQWFRHRMSNFNEISGRYTKMEPEFYIPNFVGGQGQLNKQMSTDTNMLNNEEIREMFTNYITTSKEQYNLYTQLVNKGVSREMARICLPLNLYTEFYWSIDLHNFLNFTRLRSAKNAQPEIAQYSNSAFKLIEDICPISTRAFNDYVRRSITLYPHEFKDLKYIHHHGNIHNLRHKNELKEKIDYINNGKN